MRASGYGVPVLGGGFADGRRAARAHVPRRVVSQKQALRATWRRRISGRSRRRSRHYSPSRRAISAFISRPTVHTGSSAAIDRSFPRLFSAEKSPTPPSTSDPRGMSDAHGPAGACKLAEIAAEIAARGLIAAAGPGADAADAAVAAAEARAAHGARVSWARIARVSIRSTTGAPSRMPRPTRCASCGGVGHGG